MKDETTRTDRTDVYERVTASIMKELEHGTRPWLQPWQSTGSNRLPPLPLRSTGEAYRGINILLLWSAYLERGYRSRTWMTYKQAAERGAQVRKGEKASLVVYANSITKTEANDQGEKTEREIAFMKGYSVFNVEQIDGLPAELYEPPAPPVAGRVVELIEAAEAFITKTGADVRHGGDRAYYATKSDHIQLPPAEVFRDGEAYTATKAHELMHWTGHASRMAREFGKRFGDEAYAFEELVAELGAAFLCADLGIALEPRDDHACYLAHWLKVLKEDKRAIFTAASQAQKAADYLHSLQTD